MKYVWSKTELFSFVMTILGIILWISAYSTSGKLGFLILTGIYSLVAIFMLVYSAPVQYGRRS